MANPHVRGIMAVAPLLVQAGYAQPPAYNGSSNLPGASLYTAPYGYPTTAFSSYYPTPSGQEPQPALHDPVLNITFPRNLTDPVGCHEAIFTEYR